MAGNPVPFTLEEQQFILDHIGPGPNRLSWNQIARKLGRSRQGVQQWAVRFIGKYKAEV
jgi:hypothetical protein